MNFIEAFEKVCVEKSLNYVQGYQRAEIKRDQYSKFVKNYNNSDYILPRKRAIELCMSLNLPLKDIQNLLAHAGYTLSPHLPYDRVVIDAISRHDYNVVNLKIDLYKAGLKF